MSFQLRVESLAKEDLQKAYNWYEEKQIGLGETFLDQIDIAFDQICKNPKSFQKRYEGVRINFIKQFHYGVHYIIDKKKIVVVGVFGESQSPESWNKRSHTK